MNRRQLLDCLYRAIIIGFFISLAIASLIGLLAGGCGSEEPPKLTQSQIQRAYDFTVQMEARP